MPYLSIQTNKTLSSSDINDFLSHASKTLAKLLDKPESYVMIALPTESAMQFAGSNEPCAYLQLKSLGLPEQRSPEISARLCDLVSECFGIDCARVYLEFSSPERHMWGWDRKTF